MIRLLALLLATLIAVSPVSAQQAPTSPLTDDQWVEQVFYPATVLLYKQDGQGNMKFSCTATAFEKKEGGMFGSDTYRFLTAAHCVGEDDVKAGKIEYDKRPVYITTDASDEKKFLKATVLYAGMQTAGDDFAVLEVKTREKFPLVPVGKDSESVIGEAIVNVAAPAGLGKQVFMGRVTSPKLDRPVEQSDFSWTGMVMIQLPGTNGGSSGSSVVCVKQRAICSILVGIASGTHISNPISRFSKFYEANKAGKYAPKSTAVGVNLTVSSGSSTPEAKKDSSLPD